MKDKALCKIRTITTFLSLDHDTSTWKETIAKAAACCHQYSELFLDQGYLVQSIRIVTNPFNEYLDTSNLESAKQGLRFIGDLLQESAASNELRLRFAIGEARTEQDILLLPELIQEFGDLCNICVNVGVDDAGFLDNKLILQSAAAVRKISEITPRGEGNFNFTVNFNCDPLIPYFPASYHQQALGQRFVIGLETPDLLVRVLQDCQQSLPDDVSERHADCYAQYFSVMHQALQYHIDNIHQLVQDNPNSDFQFSGFDSSAAPSKDCASMTDVYEHMGVEYFGASGTVEASALLTRVFKSIKGVDLVGFSGLMLALTEDRGLAQGSIDSHFDIRALLTYSAVCGIGLDTVPIPGDTSIEKIAALMRDTGTMAYRLNKPLTVRVFPVPGLKAGDLTAFESDDLCNCAVLAVP